MELIAIAICWSYASRPIGGWLLFYFVGLYSSAAYLAIAVPQYFSRALTSAMQACIVLGFVLQLVVSTMLLLKRTWGFVQLLRGVMLFRILVDLAAELTDPSISPRRWGAIFAVTLWLGYFYFSRRVKYVFLVLCRGSAATEEASRKAFDESETGHAPSLR
jgi:hypothetical protein